MFRQIAVLALALPLAAAEADRLTGLRDRLAQKATSALLVVQHGKTILEWYAPGHGPETRQGTASLAKALVGGMSLAFAIEDGRIAPGDPASKYIPAWRDDPLKSKITIRQLASHSSGISDAEQDSIPHAKLPGWKGAFWRRDPDPFSIAVRDAPVLFEPGTRFAYSNPGMAALAYAVTAALRGSADDDIRSILKHRLMDLLGIADDEWSIGYGRAYEVDGMRLYANWGGGAFTPRATARIGEFLLAGGRWNGAQVLNADLVKRMTAWAGTPVPSRNAANPAPASGLGWWTNATGAWSNVPYDAFAGAGAGQELLLVVPSLGLVVVRNGAALGSPDRFWADAVADVFDPIVAAVGRTPAPYPASRAIRELRFAPIGMVIRKAVDSDNWPMTWGDDDAIYTAYGDGRGFEPGVERKLSLGLAKVTGDPEAFRGENLRSDAERIGDGKAGPKASGMLMVRGVLYMWVRNTGNAELMWSADRGRSWKRAFRWTTSFGSPAFLNYGMNYAGARDGFVYVYSQDGPTAYESHDGVVLARAPVGRIIDAGAWKFYGGADARGRAKWVRDVAARKPVFVFPGHCQRVDAVYHPGLKRFLLVVGYDHHSGWGIFDSPRPEGPWTTAFHTTAWDIPGTHGYRIPAKWIRGNSMFLVFSGVRLPDRNYDAFCVREMTVK